MKVHIIAVGTKMPAWVQHGYGEYAKRLPKELTPHLRELPLANRVKNYDVEKIKNAESEHIAKVLPKSCKIVALDALGSCLSTEEVAKKLADWQMDASDVAFIIGGPDGLSKGFLRCAHEKWSLSAMTLPHPLVRIVLIEQLYRAWSILQRHPYHK